MKRIMLMLATCLPCMAQANNYDPSPAWPLCGRIAEAPPVGWDASQGCPSERWGSAAHADFPIASTFGPRQLPSDNYRYDFHRGLDIGTATGTPIFAITDGVVR
ncbi:M23 family metallopeptidase, partial [Pseudomonas sp.]|uniref:M23 family metallopeptidase n=1 Tax=Pseudomonas sp. TaxID=306 RepID=UPI00356129F4